MAHVVAIVAPGSMGAAVGKRLTGNGMRVLTSLAGRSTESVQRAGSVGMVAARDEEIAAADFILSIVPPGDAVDLARRFVPALTASNSKPVYVDCNAVNPTSVERIAAAMRPPGRRLSIAASSALRPCPATQVLAFTHPAPLRTASRRCGNMDSTCACSMAS
jgi:3-hydroxyisobutyrate dehydrogenase-like beta-hydroxyacid dehydrogenase